MVNQRIGSFIAALRREQNLTQEQLAEKIGVSNRSISRWENGNTLPDYSLLQTLATVLGVNLSELLAGQRMDDHSRTEESVQLALELAQHEKDALRKKLNIRFGAGLIFLVFGSLLCRFAAEPFVFFLLCTLLGISFLTAGFLSNNRKTTVQKDRLHILVADDGDLRMYTAAQMLQFTMKYQTGHKKQHHRAFEALAAALSDGEYAELAFIADSCTINGNPGPWHIGAALTNKRLLLCGEVVRGRFMTAIETDSYARSLLNVLHMKGGKLVLGLNNGIIKIEGRDLDPVARKLLKLLS